MGRGVLKADGLQYGDNGGLEVGDGVVDHLAVVEMLIGPGTLTAKDGKAVRLQTVVRSDGVEVDLPLVVVWKGPWPRAILGCRAEGQDGWQDGDAHGGDTLRYALDALHIDADAVRVRQQGAQMIEGGDLGGG